MIEERKVTTTKLLSPGPLEDKRRRGRPNITWKRTGVCWTSWNEVEQRATDVRREDVTV